MSAALIGLAGAAWGAPPEIVPIPPSSGTGPVAQSRPVVPDEVLPPRIGATSRAPVVPALPAEFPGIGWASFIVLPEIRAAAAVDDNIYAENDGESQDLIFTLSPSVVLKSKWQRHAFNFDAGADFDRYDKAEQEDVSDYRLGFDGRYDLGANANIFGGLRHARDHEDRASPDAISPAVADEPTLFERSEAHIGMSLDFGGVGLRFGGTFDRFDFDDVDAGIGGRINMDDRDRDVHGFGVRASYRVSPSYRVFAQVATDTRSYDARVDDAGFRRDSDGHRAAVGFDFAVTGALSGEVFAGEMRQDYDDARLSDVVKPYFGANVVWRMTRTTTIVGFVDRVLEETTQPGSSAYLDTTIGGQVEKRLSGDLTVNGRLAYTESDYIGLDRVDRIFDAGVGARYYFAPAWYVGADYRFLLRDSEVDADQYRRNQFMLSVGYTLGRSAAFGGAFERLTGAAPALATAPDGFGGLYAGAGLGYGTLGTVTKGLRGGGGTDTGPMADSGATGTAFVGYGFGRDRWYLGVELDAESSDAHWYHRKDKSDSRTARVEKDESVGIGLRVGRVVVSGALVYARLGTVRTRFDTYYTQNDPAVLAGAYRDDDTLTGTRFGVGTDLPLGGSTFLRMDYSYTDYESRDIDYLSTQGAAVERFATSESLFRVGLGWRFGGPRQPVALARPVRGFYVGAHAGHGTLDSQLDGVHTEAGPTVSNFTGAFGESGPVFGFFAGYGHNLGRWYAGFELEADANRVEWQHDRDVGGAGGRDFSVEKKDDRGIAVRLGYTLPNGALIYARVGQVRGRFKTTWAKGRNAANDVDRTDELDGSRVGIGAEVPLGRSGFLRMEYTRTDYERYGFTTTHGNPDQMTFDNRENLFRVGVGFRF